MFQFCPNLNKELKHILKYADGPVQKITTEALSLTNIVKNALTSGLATEVTTLIPGTWDDNLKANLVAATTEANKELGLFQNTLTSTGDIVTSLHTALNGLPEKVQNMWLVKYAQRITAWLDGNTQPEHVYDTIVQTTSVIKPEATQTGK